MPHGSLRVGRVDVVALCDAIVLASAPSMQDFPGASNAVWAETRRRYPEVFGQDDRWRLHVHCFVLRSDGRTVLVDTGIGGASAPAFAWSATRGRLPDELASAGISPEEIDEVVITHVHDDHLGWTVAEAGTTPLFPNARYLVHSADWALMANTQDEEDRAIFAAVLEPLERAGVLERSEDHVTLTRELTVHHAPGHTPGHQVVTVDSAEARALVSGDLVNHPVQLLQPGVCGTSDGDPPRAAATRAAWLERIDREGRLVCPTHFPEAFGRFVPEGDRSSWAPTS